MARYIVDYISAKDRRVQKFFEWENDQEAEQMAIKMAAAEGWSLIDVYPVKKGIFQVQREAIVNDEG